MENDLEKNINIEKKNRKLMNRFLVIGFIVLFSLAGFWFGLQKGKNESLSTQNASMPLESAVIINKEGKIDSLDFSLFWKTWDILKEKYVNSSKLDAQKLFYGAIKGMLAATGDPYTNFFDPEENKKFNEDITGSFEGIGAEIGMKGGVLTIIAPLEGTPAEKSGLRAGDKIIKIGDKNTSDMTIDGAVDLLHGKKGTEVKMTIFREGEQDTREISITRDVINVKSVKFEEKEGNIAYVKISRFGETTFREFGAALKQIKANNAKGIIIDLRNDPGGYLETAVEIGSKMLPKGDIVVMEEDKDGQRNKLLAKGGDEFSGIKTVVLINEGSASASEILAGALRENRDNVTLVGKKSFGKGSVQELINLSQGTSMKVTVAHWLTPKGNQINEKGIEPDVKVDLTTDDYDNNKDPQLDKALEIVKE
ncbi:MAG: S41 family peptidase [Parcubacteria group bacterium]|jgi:carboxyl-terminal processing protease